MGCSSNNGILTKDEEFLIKPLEASFTLNSMNNPPLQHVKSTIESIFLLRCRMLCQYHKVIYETGACCYKQPTIAHCLRSLLFKISADFDGCIENYGISYTEDPPYLEGDDNQLKPATKKILDCLFNFIIEIRSYKTLIKQIEKDIPELLYILFENQSCVNKNEQNLIQSSMDTFEEIKKFRNKVLSSFKSEVYVFITQNERYIEQVNNVGKKAASQNEKDVYKIVMISKEFDLEDDGKKNEEKYQMYDDIEKGKKLAQDAIKTEEKELAKHKGKKLMSVNSSTVL